MTKVKRWLNDKLSFKNEDHKDESYNNAEYISKYIKKSIQLQESYKPAKRFELSDYRFSLIENETSKNYLSDKLQSSMNRERR